MRVYDRSGRLLLSINGSSGAGGLIRLHETEDTKPRHTKARKAAPPEASNASFNAFEIYRLRAQHGGAPSNGTRQRGRTTEHAHGNELNAMAIYQNRKQQRGIGQ